MLQDQTYREENLKDLKLADTQLGSKHTRKTDVLSKDYKSDGYTDFIMGVNPRKK